MASNAYGKSVRLADETVEELHDRKEYGDSYDDVVQRLLALPSPEEIEQIRELSPEGESVEQTLQRLLADGAQKTEA